MAEATVTGASHFRGHLFADLRGSTAFTEHEGNTAGAALVARFRQLVRDEVGVHEGAAIKTEGDAIYVVFPSASTAVMCGLAIVDRAAEASAANPDLPINVGVGVHAGEAVAVPEGGYIGSAVNLASRVCAVAQAGEVLVTATVRSIAQQSIPVTFLPRGKRRLKGIADPVELYRVIPEGVAVPRAPRVRGRSVGVLAAVIALVVVVGLGLAFLAIPRDGAATPALTPAPVVSVPQIGPLAIGKYVTSQFQPRLSFDVVDPGWNFTNESSSAMSMLSEPGPGGTLDVGQISTVYTSPCVAGGESLPVVTTAQDLLDALRSQSFIHVSDPTPIFVDEWHGLIMDVTIDPSVLAACDGGAGVTVFPLGGNPYAVQPSQVFRIYAIDVGDSNVSFVAAGDGGPDASVNEIETFFGVARRLLDSVKFGR